MKYTLKLVAAAAISAGLATPVLAEELKFANFTPPFHAVNASVIKSSMLI